MALFKCKMCGAELNIFNESVAECEYCHTKQTLPRLDDKKALLYDRANYLRRNSEFDKAMAIYELVLNEDTTDAEAYWSLILCKYGIDYVVDTNSGKRIPTVNRVQYTPVASDENYKSAIKYATPEQAVIYREEAEIIDGIQKKILALSDSEEPFDVFICYKETDAQGRRTDDSVIAYNLYNEFEREGLKAFYSRITLEDKLGQEYEPYIFAALNSAKVMVVIGTSVENFNAPWVRNEWARYLQLINNGEKKIIIPAYRNIDPYDLPSEFAHLQGQDMSRIGFMQDIVHATTKFINSQRDKAKVNNSQGANGSNISNLLKRVAIFIEDKEWENAEKYCEKILDEDPENGSAYYYKFLIDFKEKNINSIVDKTDNPADNPNYSKVMKFGTQEQKNDLLQCDKHVKQRVLDDVYNSALKDMMSENIFAVKKAEKDFIAFGDYKDSKALVQQCGAIIMRLEAEQKKQNKKDKIKGLWIAVIVISLVVLLGAVVVWLILYNLPSENVVDQTENMYAGEVLEDSDGLAANEKVSAITVKPKTISAGYSHSVAVRNDGVVDSTVYRGELDGYFGQCDVMGWSDIIEVSSGWYHTVALRNNGTVVSTPYTSDSSFNYGQGDVGGWSNIKSVSAGWSHTVGLKKDGTCVATKYTGANAYYYGQCDVEEWRDIVAIDSGDYYTVGLKSDGTCVATGYNETNQCSVEGWSDIVAISAGDYHTVGVKSDGTVVSTKFNNSENSGQCDVEGWTDVVDVSAGDCFTVALKKDGTCVATGRNDKGQCDVEGWTDIVAISAGHKHTIGLKSDGTIVSTGDNRDGQGDVYVFSNVRY